MATSLIHEKLDPMRAEIKLLTLRMSTYGIIQCEHSKASLNDSPVFYALSYVWGNPTITKNILVNGKTFAATTNLVAALEMLAAEVDTQMYFWVDSICINQSDISKRNAQVRMMSSIFAQASSVLAQSGPEKYNSTEAIEIIKQISIEVKSSLIAGLEVFSKPAPAALIQKLKLDTPGSSFISLAMPRQKDLTICCLSEPSGNALGSCKKLCLQKGFFSPAVGQSLTCMMFGKRRFGWIAVTGKIHASMGNTHYAWRLAATDPRDKIYSLLGLMNIRIEVDYSKSAQEIYQETATILFHEVPRDQWLKRRGTGFGDIMPGLPSWVVDWDALQNGGWSATIAGDLYHADSGMADLSSQTKIYQDSLRIPGVLCDEIEFLTPFLGTIDSNAQRGL